MVKLKLIYCCIISALVGCTSPPTVIKNVESSKAVTDTQKAIGVATMDTHGNLSLQLRLESDEGAVGDALFTYKKDDAHYEEVLKHIGPIQPGETVIVRPWPDK